jgi:hypothetical protein
VKIEELHQNVKKRLAEFLSKNPAWGARTTTETLSPDTSESMPPVVQIILWLKPEGKPQRQILRGSHIGTCYRIFTEEMGLAATWIAELGKEYGAEVKRVNDVVTKAFGPLFYHIIPPAPTPK